VPVNDVLFDPLTGDRDPVETTNEIERLAGTKRRSDPVTV
jgi:hypothetical protein